MKLPASVIVAVAVSFLVAAAAAVYCFILLLQGTAVLLEIIAIALETSP